MVLHDEVMSVKREIDGGVVELVGRKAGLLDKISSCKFRRHHDGFLSGYTEYSVQSKVYYRGVCDRDVR